MPIKDISKEEQSHLYLPGGAKREHLQLTETDRGEEMREDKSPRSQRPSSWSEQSKLQEITKELQSLSEATL